jgi:poly(3-hydroxybutyrate) depolymerase
MRPWIFALVVALASSTHAAPKITKHTITSVGKERVYHRFIPSRPGEAAPLIVFLHGSGRDGKKLLEHWTSLAEKEGIILAGPDAIQRAGWATPDDGPVFLRDVVRDIQKVAPVDGRRVYLFGHSAGGHFAVPMALLQSKYFAAAAAHAGGLYDGGEEMVRFAARKIPIFLIVGVKDTGSVGAARRTNQLLSAEGFPVSFEEMPFHGHNYYGRSRAINEKVWSFLSAHALDSEPEYTSYANIPE